MRLLAIWMIAALGVAMGAAALLWLSTGSAAEFSVDGDRLTVSGQLSLASTERLDRLLDQNGDLSTLVLGEIAPGSDATAILQKGLLIRGSGLSTEIGPGVTLRGDAVYLFLAGVERRMGAGAGIAVSDWQSRVGPASMLARDHPAHQERLDYVTRMIGDPDFYWFTLEAGAGEMAHAMTAAELRDYGVVSAD